MNRRRNESPSERSDNTIGYHLQLSFLLDTIEFVLSKLDELCKWKNQQEGLKRKKSVLKFFDKNIDTLPNFRAQPIEMPVFDEFPKMIDRVQLHKISLPANETLDSKTTAKLERLISSEVVTIAQRISQVQQRTRSLERDMLQLIGLYKDLL